METVCEQDRRPPDKPQRLLRGKAAAAAIVAASLATVGVVFATMQLNDARTMTRVQAPASRVDSTPARPNPVAERGNVAAPKPPPAPVPATAVAIDDRGFVNSKARCEGPQRAVAIGRTNRSVVVICEAPNGDFEYTGVRLSDDAAMRVDDVRVTASGFEARSDGAVYLVSSKELLVMSGDAVLARDAMVEYRGR